MASTAQQHGIGITVHDRSRTFKRALDHPFPEAVRERLKNVTSRALRLGEGL